MKKPAKRKRSRKTLSTLQKLKFLQAFVLKVHKKLRSRHVTNIVGLRVGKKRVKGKDGLNYAIIYQVERKRQPRYLVKKETIPESIKIKFPDGIVRIIKTDVEESGRMKLHSGIGSRVRSKYSSRFGSVGLFVTDDTDTTYMISNYHVVAEAMIGQNRLAYKRTPTQTKNDVLIYVNPNQPTSGRFEVGRISHTIDVAFVDLRMQPNQMMNSLPAGEIVQGKISSAADPLPPIFKGRDVIVYCNSKPNGQLAIINDNSAIMYTKIQDIYFEDVIQLRPRVTVGGDSGGLVVMNSSYAVLGIIVGGDDNYSYAIPINKICTYKTIDII